MEKVLYYLVVLFVIFIILYIFEYLIKSKRNKLGNTKDYNYIVHKYKLNMNLKKKKTLSKILIIDNSIILSIPVYIVLITDINLYILLIIAFIVFMILLVLTYNLIGKSLKKKGW